MTMPRTGALASGDSAALAAPREHLSLLARLFGGDDEQTRARLRRVALPAEHGSWGLVAEPLVLGFAVAPSLGGAFIAIASLAAFLTRQPLKIALEDARRGVHAARTVLARRVAVAYSAIAFLAFAVALLRSGTALLMPLALAAPFALLQLFNDATGRSRSLVAELCGAAAMSSSAAVLALAAGWRLEHAAALSALMLCRSLPAILYVRARLRLERGAKQVAALPVTAHIVALAILVAIGERTAMPVLALIPFALLLLRSAAGLSRWRLSFKPKQIGYSEVAYGAATVVFVALAYVA